MSAAEQQTDSAEQAQPIEAALIALRYRQLDRALGIFGDVLCDGIPVPDAQVAELLIEVAGALIAAFQTDGQSPAAYDFFRRVTSEAADIIAGLIEIANFPQGDEDPTTLPEPIMLTFAGALGAAGRHDDAISLLTQLLLKKSNHLPLSHAMFVAQCRQAGRSDDLRGRFCQSPFYGFDVLPGGNVHLCCAAHLPKRAGNLFANDHLAIWNSRDAQAVRQSIHDGSYRYCDKLKCPKFSEGLPLASEVAAASATGANSELVEIIAHEAVALDIAPAIVNLSFDRTCNLACPSCRSDFIAAKSAERDQMLKMTEMRIMPMLRTARQVTVTGSGDPFASKTFRHILRELKPEDYPDLTVNLITNGVLFTPAEWERIAHLHGRMGILNISIDAACAETYAVVRRGGDWERLLQNLAFLSGLVQHGAIKSMLLAFVVQARNWREMPAFVELGRRFNVNQVYFSPIENWGTFSESEFAAQAVHFETHPDHEDFRALLATARELDDPIVRFGGAIPLLRAQPVVRLAS